MSNNSEKPRHLHTWVNYIRIGPTGRRNLDISILVYQCSCGRCKPANTSRLSWRAKRWLRHRNIRQRRFQAELESVPISPDPLVF